MSGISQGIRIHLDDPRDEFEVELVEIGRIAEVSGLGFLEEEGLDVFGVSSGLLFEGTHVDQESACVHTQVVVQDYYWAELLQ